MIKPIGKRVLIKPIEDTNTLVGGIVRPQSDDMKPMRGCIVDVGDELEEKSDWLLSATVYYPRYTGAEVEVSVNNVVIKLLIVEYEDLLGFEKKEK